MHIKVIAEQKSGRYTISKKKKKTCLYELSNGFKQLCVYRAYHIEFQNFIISIFSYMYIKICFRIYKQIKSKTDVFDYLIYFCMYKRKIFNRNITLILLIFI